MEAYEQVQKGPLKLKGVAELGVTKRKKKKKDKDKAKLLEAMGTSKKSEEEKRRCLDKRTPAQAAFEKMQEKRQMERILKKASKTHKQRVETGHNGPRAASWTGSGGKCRGARRALLNAGSSCRCRCPRLLPRPFKAAMSASAVYVLDLKGKVLICRNYRGDVDMSEVEHFMPILMEKEEEGMLSPILAHGGVRFMWIKHNNLYLVATSKKNACVSLVFSFLYKVVQVFSEYFKELEEESIRDNFVIIYELLDELMDFGYPQTTDSKILQEYITQEGHKLETGAPRPPATVTNAVSWRSEGIKYRKNEVFLDVIEAVNLLVSANGNVLRSEIVGSIKMRVFLSGMPELRLGLNDKVLFDNTGRGKSKSVELEDVKFHQCVRLSRFENDRTISFIPPDGEFELMSYRLNTHVKPLIWIESVIEKHSHSRIEYMVKAKSQFKRRSTANNVEIHIPVPNDADSPKFKTTVGSVKWVPENSEIVWSIKSFPGGKEYLMRAHFGLPSVEAEDKEGKPPISVKFEIPYFTTSGIQVRYLKIIEKSGYQALPWVRYITQNGAQAMFARGIAASVHFICVGEKTKGRALSRASAALNCLKRFHEMKKRGPKPYSLHLDHIIQKAIATHQKRDQYLRVQKDIFVLKVLA
ncbi:AP-1 complex subunit mu-1 [Microtus ochrogaster]|uniref:AP-1 complex subunit mu-1 n=2 Tax=Muroidea TaxID=337687 RepID=A0A8J6G5X1_MICOH|nr:AP-1 complex subunit mu-1 [Microtus ochrogaster]